MEYHTSARAIVKNCPKDKQTVKGGGCHGIPTLLGGKQKLNTGTKGTAKEEYIVNQKEKAHNAKGKNEILEKKLRPRGTNQIKGGKEGQRQIITTYLSLIESKKNTKGGRGKDYGTRASFLAK